MDRASAFNQQFCGDTMRPDDILEWVKAVPFRPFKIVLNGGTEFEIRHPEMVKVGRTTVNIFTFTNADNEVYERMQMVGLILIERIDPLAAPTKAQ
jgi:hypothetical protein